MSLVELTAALKHAPPVLAQLRGLPGLHLVGGWLRDAYWGHASRDIDLIAPQPLAPVLEALEQLCGSAPFMLNERFASYRANCDGLTIDVTPMCEGGLAADLARRDYTINALAVPVAGLGSGAHSGLVQAHPQAFADLDARVLRMASRANLAEDPLRVLRGYRLLAQGALVVDGGTHQAWRELAADTLHSAPERIHEELVRLLRGQRGVEPALRRAADDGLLFELLPPLKTTVGCGQNDFHHLDVWEHTLLCLSELARIRTSLPPELGEYSEQLAEDWERPVSGMATVCALTRLALLLHDVGKPPAREVQDDGHVSFYKHQDIGTQLLEPELRWLKFSTDEIEFVSLLVREHLRVGFYSGHDPLPPKLTYRFIRKLGDATPAMVMHSLADCAAARGGLSEGSWERHVRCASQLLEHYFAADAVARPPVLLDGYAIMKLLGIKPDKLVGRLKNALLEATAAGEVANVEQAEEYVRGLHREITYGQCSWEDE